MLATDRVKHPTHMAQGLGLPLSLRGTYPVAYSLVGYSLLASMLVGWPFGRWDSSLIVRSSVWRVDRLGATPSKSGVCSIVCRAHH